MCDEFLKPYTELYIWSAYYKQQNRYNDYLEETYIKRIISDRKVYDELYDLTCESEDILTDMNMMRICKYVKPRHEPIIEELFNPGRLKLGTLEKIKRMRNKNVAELLFIKAITYLNVSTQYIRDIDGFDISLYLWFIYVIKLYKSTIENMQYLHYLDDSVKLWIDAL